MKKLLLLTLFLSYGLVGYCQESSRIVRGTVTSSEDGAPLPGVNVILKGTSNGTVTGVDGEYNITVTGDAKILVFSFIGFQAKEVDIQERAVIDVQMELDVQQLSEVVITANNIERSRRSLGYSVTEIDSDELLKARETNILNSLQGRVAGVDIINSGGSIGGSSKILIRGASALSTDVQPLMVVDGVPIFNNSIRSVPGDGGDAAFANDYDYGNAGQDINPDDIATITILKGATAAALYGQRARNGAIIITTKTGRSNKGKTSVSLNSSIRFDRPFRSPDLQSKYAVGTNGTIADNTTFSWGPEIKGQNLNGEGNWQGQAGPLTAYPNNFDDFFETGRTLINSVAISGGEESTNYRIGYTNKHQTGIVPNTELSSNTISLNAGTRLANKISSSIGIQYVNTNNDGRPSVGYGNSIGGLIYTMPITYNINDLKNYKDEFGVQRPIFEGSDNPYWLLYENVFELDRDRVIGNTTIQYDPFTFLNITGRVGVDIVSEQRFSPQSKGTENAPEGSFFRDEINQRQFNSDLIITYDHSFSDALGLKVIGGWNVNQRTLSQFTMRSNSLTAPGLYRPSNAEQNIPSIYESIRRLMGAYFDVGLEFNDYLFLNITGRNDWTSTLPKENNSFFYPSVSTSFIFSDAFGISNDVFSFGKLRASWAQVGSDTDPYSLDFQYYPSESVFFVLSGGTGLAFPFQGQLGFSATGSIPPQNLVPEMQTSWEIGTDLQFFNSRVRLDIGYFNTRTEDQIIGLPISPSTGFTNKLINVGTTENSGIELLLSATPVTGDFQWDISANYTKIDQVVISLAEGVEEFAQSGGINGLQVKAVPGESFGLYGKKFAIDSASGQYLIDAQGYRIAEQDVRLGSVNPDFTMGLSNTFSYKGLSLSFLLDYRQGGVLYSNTIEDLRILGLAEETTDRDRLVIDKGLVELAGGELVPNTTAVSLEDWWINNSTIEEGSTFENTWLKLREVRIGYSLPNSVLRRTPFGSVNFAVEGRNLLLLYSKVPHIDPEQNVFGSDDNATGIEAGGLPSTRSVGFNISLTF